MKLLRLNQHLTDVVRENEINLPTIDPTINVTDQNHDDDVVYVK